MDNRCRLYDLLDQLGVRNKRAREAIALILEADPTLERPIEQTYQLAGERAGRGYTAILHRVRVGIAEAWENPTEELERLFCVSICKKPVKPKHFLKVVKNLLETERSNERGTD